MIRNRACARRVAVVGALVALFLLSVVGTLLAAEFVVNGGFEDGFEPWDEFGQSFYSVTVTTAQAHSGSQSVLLSVNQGDANVEQEIVITQNIAYTLSFWSFGDGITQGYSAYFNVWVNDSDSQYCGILLSTLDEWSYNECYFTPTNTGPYTVRFYYWNDSVGSVYVDDVSIVGEGVSIPPPDESTNASTCLMLLLIKLSVAMVVFFAVVSLGMWLGQINIF